MLARSVAFFLLAGLLEIGGGYLIWLTVREHRPLWLGIVGSLALAGYGVVATFQPANFGRVYAAYGGVYVGTAILWLWKPANPHHVTTAPEEAVDWCIAQLQAAGVSLPSDPGEMRRRALSILRGVV